MSATSTWLAWEEKNCLGISSAFNYAFLILSNATFAPKNMFNFSAILIFYVSQSQPLWFLHKAGSSWQGAQRPHLASSQVAQTLNIKSSPISPHSTLMWLVSGLWQIRSPSACYSSFQFSTGTSLSLGSPRIWSQVVMLLCNKVFINFKYYEISSLWDRTAISSKCSHDHIQ